MNFNEYAKEWDNDYRIDRAKKIATKIMHTLDLSSVETAMEFGCGTGLISFNLFEELNKTVKSIDLIDSSQGMIGIVENKISILKTDKIKAYCTDILAKSSDKKYDFIYTSMVLHHITNLDQILNTLYSYLNEKGILCIVDLNEEDGSFHEHDHSFEGHNGFAQIKLKEILKVIGLHDIESETFYYGFKGSGNKKTAYSLFIMTAMK